MRGHSVLFSKVITFCAPEELAERIKCEAREHGVKPSEYIRQTLRERVFRPSERERPV